MDVTAVLVIVLLVVTPAPHNGVMVVIFVLAVVMIAMMYIAGVIGLLVFMEAVELETVNNAQVLFNYLKNIANYKFDSLYIYSKQSNQNN